MASIKVDLTRQQGPFKPVNGIDNGPVCFGSLIDSSRFYKQAAFPYCRLHDTNYPHPREVDIPTIFRDFAADADDPASYDFRATDVYLNEILATGAKIIYRLGISIEHPALKYYVDPPADFDKWAKICLNIARHYNEGWANGFEMGIDYWEVWNEPDQLATARDKDVMWAGTPEEYYELYVTTAKLFKKEMPGVKIGGYAGCGLLAENRYQYFLDFLQYVKDKGAPLDFYSWHVYTSRLEDIHENARRAREGLDRYGFTGAESILDEWNYIPQSQGGWHEDGNIFSGNGSRRRLEVFSETCSEVGASFTAAAFIEMLDMPLDIATFYEGQPVNIFGTIFDRYGEPTKQFYAFDAFNRLKQAGQRAAAACDIPGAYAAAAGNAEKACVLAANWDAFTATYPLEIKGLDETADYRCELVLLDKWRTMEVAERFTGKPKDLPASLYLHRNSVALASFTRL